MKYRKDSDLEFFKDCSASDLDPLVLILTRDKEGMPRWTEQLTSHPRFQQCTPNHKKYWELIAAELQCFGANTVVTHVLRGGQGVLYREILMDVCNKLK